ncbi:uncharacterized protein LOC118182106 [Stegodyphus dumicola]|uniref:uncharacterized protein LOC118182106 n=1 Tax=Stegodyphus dumicola TaxID=202533 RepID=UPI0015A95599|nr:uncharacterized protein LOC118182106 [Stegodyphus dumicola]
MLERGGFLLRKWSSNDLSVLENIPQELRNDSEAMKIQDDSSIKVLGINWNPREDYFNFSVSISGEKLKYSKRDILSDLAKIFDPLGWLAPCIIYVKILIQEMWKLHLS